MINPEKYNPNAEEVVFIQALEIADIDSAVEAAQNPNVSKEIVDKEVYRALIDFLKNGYAVTVKNMVAQFPSLSKETLESPEVRSAALVGIDKLVKTDDRGTYAHDSKEIIEAFGISEEQLASVGITRENEPNLFN